jgi:hypothetical protein
VERYGGQHQGVGKEAERRSADQAGPEGNLVHSSEQRHGRGRACGERDGHQCELSVDGTDSGTEN